MSEPPFGKHEEKHRHTSAPQDISTVSDPRAADTKWDNKQFDNIDDETASSSCEEDDSSMPVFKYARLAGSLPRSATREQERPLSELCTCSAMGRVALPSSSSSSMENGGVEGIVRTSSGGSSILGGASNTFSSQIFPPVLFILAIGFESGKLCLVDAMSGNTVLPSAPLQVHYPGSKPEPIVDVCFDSSGAIVAAINAGGLVAIWELKYSTNAAGAAAARSSFATQDDSVFGFFTRSTASSSAAAPVTSSSPTLSVSSIQISRISYPDSFGPPTCFHLDPAYKKRGVKALVVGFQNGRVVLTKRGFIMFGRRNDSVLCQAGSSGGGIQALAWRGSLVAWADATNGIKLYEVESMTRIAHIDRPSGARPSLYPTLSSLKATLLFETSDSLLVAWGDCVMCMSIRDVPNYVSEPSAARAVGGPFQGDAASTGAVVKKPKHVECTMAWELDCVACGVVPLDREHLVVLGLVLPDPAEDSGNGDEDNANLASNAGNTDLEVQLQVISRLRGHVVHSDALPLMKQPRTAQESASAFTLLSSYALPRMENAMEAEEEGFHVEDEDFDFEVSLFRSTTRDIPGFKDCHIKWSINELSFDSVSDKSKNPIKDVEVRAERKHGILDNVESEELSNDGGQSLDSDDYELLFRPLNIENFTKTGSSLELPPIMIIASQWDVVLVRTRDVDDAVAHAVAEKKHAVALGRALCYKRELRRYDINDLINGYLSALLHVPNEVERNDEEIGRPRQLSVLRLRLAAKALPTLLGGNIGMWEKWVSIFAEIPGALFVLKNYLPVRDPKLSPKLYEKVLEKMISEVQDMGATSGHGENSLVLFQQAKEHFLSTLRAWGPTSALRENMRYFSYYDDPQRQKRLGLSGRNPKFDEAESSLLRRLHQTAVGFLEFPILSSTSSSAHSSTQSGSPLIDTADSLFRVETLVSAFSSHTSLIPPSNIPNFEVERPRLRDSCVSLGALAELNIMRGMHEKSLKCFLSIGCLKAFPSLALLEDDAVLNAPADTDHDRDHGFRKTTAREFMQYAHVIALIEYHHLHFCLLKEDFVSGHNDDLCIGNSGTDSPELLPPLVALIRLVGLDFVGVFLVEHCVQPVGGESYCDGRFSPERALAQKNRDWSTTLPLNLIAKQFSTRPKLLYWFLNLLFEHKPEIYVKFPNTAVPPPEIRELHRNHLDLCIRYAGSSKDSASFISNATARSTDDPATSLLKFLKAVLPLGGVRPDEVKRLLATQRTGNSDPPLMEATHGEVKFPTFFALELAYAMEHYGKTTEEEATAILDLYLKGAKSLSLAAFFAQRSTAHSPLLWGRLLDYCLDKNHDDDCDTATEKEDGTLFGSLLEAAALSGADLAHLVTEIPQGMRIEGLRPRLVAAVTDYRLKLLMHKAAAEIIANDRVFLLCELGHRSRRGMRHQVQGKVADNEPPTKHEASHVPTNDVSRRSLTKRNLANLSSTQRPSQRRTQRRLSFSLPVR